MTTGVLPASFRDPDGFLFQKDGVLYRQVNGSYAEDYNMLMGSGLYGELVSEGLMIGHDEADLSIAMTPEACRVIRPHKVRFISYPYEWCFSALKDAALLTLDIQKRALARGMSLKDASVYNVQIAGGKPVFIDTLSFEKYPEGEPWVAYRQFCMHFLAPLALMSRRDVRFGELFRVYIDGIPLDLASSLLPLGTWLSPSLVMHVHMHARSQLKHAGSTAGPKTAGKVSRLAMTALIDSLEGAVQRLEWKDTDTEWAEYYHDTNYSEEGMEHKRRLVESHLDEMKPVDVWDLGANVGGFSRLASSRGIPTVSLDVDPACIEKSYAEMRQKGEGSIIPLLYDATNPSPDIGWDNAERMSLTARGPCDLMMALALIHHLVISNNVPLEKVARYFARLCRSLIIEFVPKDDSQVRRLLATREDIFPDYTREGFEQGFGKHFAILRKDAVADSGRVIYLMRNLVEPGA